MAGFLLALTASADRSICMNYCRAFLNNAGQVVVLVKHRVVDS